jgi:hypothetical protein
VKRSSIWKAGAGVTCLLACAFLLPSLAQAAAPPTISATSVSTVTETSATLQATVNPNERKITDYHFEYIAQSDWEADGEAFGAQTQTTPVGEINGSAAELKEGHTVSAPVAELTPGTAYRFRLSAHNNQGASEGEEATFRTFAPPPSLGPCANDALRAGPSAALPDCRAYEQVSPTDKGGADVAAANLDAFQASLDGEAVTFGNNSGIPGGVGSQAFPLYVGRRGEGGWSIRGLLPPPSYGEISGLNGWTPDLRYALDQGIKPGNPGRESSAVLQDLLSGAFTEAFPYQQGTKISYAGASADDSKIFFEATVGGAGVPVSSGPPGAPGKNNLYVWEPQTGALTLVGVLPQSEGGEAPAAGSFAGPYDWWGAGHPPTASEGGAEAEYYLQDLRAFSADGSRAYFTAGGGQLYLRKGIGTADPETLHVSAPQRSGGPDPAGPRPAAFQTASADGSKAFFTSPEELTDDANAGPPQPPPAIGRAGIGGSPIEEGFLPGHHALGIAVSPDGEHLYWADPALGTIGRAKLNGAGAATEPEPEFIVPGEVDFQTLDDEFGEPDPQHITGPTRPRYVAVGPCAGGGECVYWTNTGPANQFGDPVFEAGTIGRAKLDSEGNLEEEEVDPQFITRVSAPQGIAVNSEHVYWANGLEKLFHEKVGREKLLSIARATIDGQNVEPKLDSFNAAVPNGLVLDGSFVYWASNEGGETLVSRAGLDGAGETFLFVGEGVHLRGIAVDASHVYWAEQQKEALGRIPIGEIPPAGASCETIAGCEREWLKAQGSLNGLAVDPEHLYFSLNGGGIPNPGNDLYRFEAQKPAGERLADLTPDSADENGAEVQGVIGTSPDGSRTYFAANGVLAANEGALGTHASSGDCHQSGGGEGAYSGSCNLYLLNEGQLQFIAHLDGEGEDSFDWAPQPNSGSPPGSSSPRSAWLSQDGATLVFRSKEQLSSYENRGVPEFYRFHLGEAALLCLTCNPSGLPPEKGPSLFGAQAIVGPASHFAFFTRNLSTDGRRFFFQTAEALVGADRNGQSGCPPIGGQIEGSICQDVYEWEAPGADSCRGSSEDGCLYLLSPGTVSDPAFFVDASRSGDDVFLTTAQSLVPQDADAIKDIYDVRVQGGLPAQHALPQIPCKGEACKPALTPPPAVSQPATSNFRGPPNQRPPRICPKGRVRRHGRCLKPPRHRKPKHRRHRAAHRHSHRNQGGHR